VRERQPVNGLSDERKQQDPQHVAAKVAGVVISLHEEKRNDWDREPADDSQPELLGIEQHTNVIDRHRDDGDNFERERVQATVDFRVSFIHARLGINVSSYGLFLAAWLWESTISAPENHLFPIRGGHIFGANNRRWYAFNLIAPGLLIRNTNFGIHEIDLYPVRKLALVNADRHCKSSDICINVLAQMLFLQGYENLEMNGDT
jgi:hypothetical protein